MRSIRILLVLCLILGCSTVRLQSQAIYDSHLIGYSGSFLEIPLGAKALGMGGAFTAIADDGTAFYWNPAGIALTENMMLSGMYSSQYGSLGSAMANYYFAGWAMPVSNYFNFSANWIRFAVGDIPFYEDLTTIGSATDRLKKIQEMTGNPVTFGDVEDAFLFGFARNFKFGLSFGWSYTKIPIEVPVGVNMKIVHQSLADNSATGIGLDLGAMMRINFKDVARSEDWPLMSLGASVKNIGGTPLAWAQTHRSEDIEQTVDIGIAFVQPVRPFDATITLALSHTSLRDGESNYGMEVQYHKRYSFRLGLNNSTFTLGAGMNFIFFEADYAYLASSENQLGQVHRLSLSFNFDKLLERATTEQPTN